MKFLLWYSTIAVSIWVAGTMYMGLTTGGIQYWISAIPAIPVSLFLWKLALAFGKGEKETT